jgi:type IV secretion system protein VirB10
VLLVSARLIFRDVRSLVLECQLGANAVGHAGFEDRVDNSWASILSAAGLSTLLAVGAELSLDEEDRLARALRDSALDTVNEVGQRIVQRQLEFPPTLTIRPCFHVRVIGMHDLVFAPPGG